MNFKTLRTAVVWGVTLSLLVLLPSCDALRPDLDVENENQPSRSEVLGTPQDVSGIASGLWRDYQWAYQGASSWAGVSSALLETMADTWSCNWANFGMNQMSSEPRPKWTNSSAYAYAESTETPWFDGYTIVSNTSDILSAIASEELSEEDFEDATRLKAFSNFMMGLVYGKLAANFDRAFLVDETTDLEAVATGEKELPLEKYPVVADFALQKLDKAQQFAGQGHKPLPSEWIFGLEISDQQLNQLASSYKARIAAMTARTPDERSSLSHVSASWSDIRNWIDNGLEANGYSGQFAAKTVQYPCGERNCPDAFGIPNDRSKTTPAGFAPISNGGFGPEGLDALKWMATQSSIWARADYRTIGPADTSNSAADCQGTHDNDGGGDDGKNSCFKEYINTLEGGSWQNSYEPYVTETPDRRISGPEGPKDHGKFFDFVGTALNAFPPPRGSYHYSDRTFVRYQYHSEGGGPSAGEPIPLLTKPEMDLLKAEAILHMGGDASKAAALINNTRVENGELRPATASDPVGSISDPPNPLPGYPTDQPTLWSMLKYEFHIETMVTGAGVNFYTRRGWGDLVEGTPLHFPIPEKELNTLRKSAYTFGGVGGRCSAGNPSNCFGGAGGGSSSISGLEMDLLKTFQGRSPVRTSGQRQVR